MNGIWHFSFTIGDIKRSLEFYCGLLRLELVHEQEQANEYTSRLVGYPDAHLKVALLAVPGQPRLISTHHLELIEYVNPKREPREMQICIPGSAHMAFVVEELETEYRRLSNAGVQFVSPPNAILSGVNAGGFTCYFRDPDDITLEMVQPPARGGRD
jgi:catechol 2,3-dioxygenase-like lactoylglutathione lyase family enzyme